VVGSLKLNSLYQGDCLQVIKYLPNESIDLIVMDPPYGIKYLSNHYTDINYHYPIINDDRLFCPLDDFWRLIKPEGAIFCFYSHKKPLIDSRVKNVIIWVKNNWTAGDLKGDYGNQYECLAFIPKNKFKINGYRFSNVWNFKRCKPDLHPTQKPLDLISQIIETGSKENNIVLDPFAGSSTVAKACLNLNRHFICIEQDPIHFQTSLVRLKMPFKKIWA